MSAFTSPSRITGGKVRGSRSECGVNAVDPGGPSAPVRPGINRKERIARLPRSGHAPEGGGWTASGERDSREGLGGPRPVAWAPGGPRGPERGNEGFREASTDRRQHGAPGRSRRTEDGCERASVRSRWAEDGMREASREALVDRGRWRGAPGRPRRPEYGCEMAPVRLRPTADGVVGLRRGLVGLSRAGGRHGPPQRHPLELDLES